MQAIVFTAPETFVMDTVADPMTGFPAAFRDFANGKTLKVHLRPSQS